MHHIESKIDNDSTYKILDHPIIAQRYFFPRPVTFSDPVFVATSEAKLGCWRSAPPSDRPVVVYFHGNGEVVSDWINILPQLCEPAGYDVFLAEYRGYGMSTGQPALHSMLEDVEFIAQAVGVPPSQVIVFGRSVGSIYALEWISRFPDTRGLIIESGIHDVWQRLRLRMKPEELGCTEVELRAALNEYINHQAKLSGYHGPSLFMHAEGDQLVTIEHAQANLAAARCGRLERFPRGGHNDILMANITKYTHVLRGFLSESIVS